MAADELKETKYEKDCSLVQLRNGVVLFSQYSVFRVVSQMRCNQVYLVVFFEAWQCGHGFIF